MFLTRSSLKWCKLQGRFSEISDSLARIPTFERLGTGTAAAGGGGGGVDLKASELRLLQSV